MSGSGMVGSHHIARHIHNSNGESISLRQEEIYLLSYCNHSRIDIQFICNNIIDTIAHLHADMQVVDSVTWVSVHHDSGIVGTILGIHIEYGIPKEDEGKVGGSNHRIHLDNLTTYHLQR